jgi:hypothetical protein
MSVMLLRAWANKGLPDGERGHHRKKKRCGAMALTEWSLDPLVLPEFGQLTIGNGRTLILVDARKTKAKGPAHYMQVCNTEPAIRPWWPKLGASSQWNGKPDQRSRLSHSWSIKLYQRSLNLTTLFAMVIVHRDIQFTVIEYIKIPI